MTTNTRLGPPVLQLAVLSLQLLGILLLMRFLCVLRVCSGLIKFLLPSQAHTLLLTQMDNSADRTPLILGIPWCCMFSTKTWQHGRRQSFVPKAFSEVMAESLGMYLGLLGIHLSTLDTSRSSGVCWAIHTKQMNYICHGLCKPENCDFNPVLCLPAPSLT